MILPKPVVEKLGMPDSMTFVVDDDDGVRMVGRSQGHGGRSVK